MKVNVKGLVLEKFETEKKNNDGILVKRQYIRIYQNGERINLDVNVNSDTYNSAVAGKQIELEDITVSAFNNYLYARQ